MCLAICSLTSRTRGSTRVFTTTKESYGARSRITAGNRGGASRTTEAVEAPTVNSPEASTGGLRVGLRELAVLLWHLCRTYRAVRPSGHALGATNIRVPDEGDRA